MSSEQLSFKGARVFVTGCMGFIGGAFINSIIDEAELVVGMDFLCPFSSKKNVNPHPKFHFVKGDICQSDLVTHVLNQYQPTILAHFASMEHVNTAQYGNSTAFTKNNVVGTHTLLECCRAYGKLQRFLYVSTDEVYGRGSGGHESGILTPSNPYAATHAAAEAIAWSYFKSFNVPTVITRVCTVYGPRQFPEKLIPRFTAQLVRSVAAIANGAALSPTAQTGAVDSDANEVFPLIIDGDGAQRRTVLYIDDCIAALRIAILHGIAGERYNVASQWNVSVAEVADALLTTLAVPAELRAGLVQHGPARGIAGDTRVRAEDEMEKMKDIGFEAAVSFEDGLARTVEWFKDNVDTWWEGVDARQLAAHVKSKTGHLGCGIDSRNLRVC